MGLMANHHHIPNFVVATDTYWYDSGLVCPVFDRHVRRFGIFSSRTIDRNHSFPLILLFIYVDGSLDRIKEMLRFGSLKRVLILVLAIPIVVTIIDFLLTMIYAITWIGIFGEPSTNTDLGTNWGSSSIDIAFLFLSVAIVTPIAEELFFRGYILDAINRKHGDWPAIIWSAILFGLVHLDPFTMGQAFMGGIIYGWIRMRTGSLLPSIACHMMWNILALMLTYL